MGSTEPRYYSLLSFDVSASGSRSTEGSVRLRATLREALAGACAAAGFAWDDCAPADTGDGFTLHVPAEVAKRRLISPFMGHLADDLRHRNRAAGPDDQVRVRAAFHAGDLERDADGLTGSPKVLLARLLESDPVRRALTAAPETATVALIVSEAMWDAVITQGGPGLDPDLFTEATAATKEGPRRAWVTVVGRGAPDVGPTPPPPPPPATLGGIHFGANAVVRGDVVNQKIVYGK